MKAIKYIGFLVVMIVLSLPTNPQDQKPKAKQKWESTPKMQRAIKRAIKWLIANQNDDGSWGCEKGQPASVALTSLATLCLLAAGYSPTTGEYSKEIQKAVKFLKKIAKEKSMLYAHDSTQMGPTFEHACATLVLAVLYKIAPKVEKKPGRTEVDTPFIASDLEELIRNAMKKLGELQNPDGSWSKVDNEPEPGVTAMAFLAARAAYSTGIFGKETPILDKIKKFIENYRPGISRGHNFYGLSAYLQLAYGLRQKHKKEAQNLTIQMLNYKLGQEYRGRMSEWDYLAAFFSTGALVHDRESENWKKWFCYVRDHLIKTQKIEGPYEGYWIVEYCLHCKVFATTMALLSLLTPYDTYPLVQD